ncbi:MAG TPA: MBOAT family protein, partial [Lachnospiraceae bacterium]|nr:MBOAT family protein [Lachnospiraceae bacterium]
HITLGTWFKDYIFYPLSIAKPIMKLGKWTRTHVSQPLGKRIPIYLPMIVVWAATGMWHGSENRYVVWGLLNCVFIILGTEFEPVSKWLIKKFHVNEKGLVLKTFRIVKTFWLMAFLRIFDISKNVDAAFETMKYMFMEIPSFRLSAVFADLNLPAEEFAVACAAILILFCVSMLQRSGSLRERIFRLPIPLQWCVLSALVGAVVIFGFYGRGFDAQQFIYLQF